VTVRLATGRYKTFRLEQGIPVAITVGKPKWPLGYAIEHEIRWLAPWGLMRLDGDEFVRAYRDQLDRLDLDVLIERFEAIGAQHGGQRLVLLCFEKPGELCHRRVFAEWFEEHTGRRVPEVEDPQLQLHDEPAPATGA
jgi:hypothetical protein